MRERKTYYVILAGGSGKRLWPLSSNDHPKQFLPLIGGVTLLEQTVKRATTLTEPDDRVMVVIGEKHEARARQLLAQYDLDFLCEPLAKNTGPAVLFACLTIHQKDPDARVVILPADHFIPEQKAFASMIGMGLRYASQTKQIVLFGKTPTRPATGYGYIQTAKKNISGWCCFGIERFHEKPDEVDALSYYSRSDMLWNIGIFIGCVKSMLFEFIGHMPRLYTDMLAYCNGNASYSRLQHISIDHAVLEKSNNLVVFPVTFSWSDVGDIATFLELKELYEHKNERVISINGSANLAMSNKKTVAFVGVSNLCLVETDDVIAIISKQDTESVRGVGALLAEKEKHANR